MVELVPLVGRDEGALDLREIRERRDKIFAEKTEHAKILDQTQQFSVGNFHFFGRGRTNFVGGVFGIASKIKTANWLASDPGLHNT